MTVSHGSHMRRPRLMGIPQTKPNSCGLTPTRYMTRLVICICILVLGASCVFVRQTKEPTTSAPAADVLTIFLTGNTLGALKPCGCSGGQLGGLDRRPAIFNSVPRERRLIVDTGSFVESDSEQDLIKFNVIVRAFDLLDYDLVNLSEQDVKIVGNLGLLDGIGSVLNVMSPYEPTDAELPAGFRKRLSPEGEAVSITVATLNAESEQKIEQIGELFARQPDVRTVNILILNDCDTATAASIAKKVPVVDCLVCPSDSDEPRVIGDPNSRPLVFSVGRFGRYICRLRAVPCEDKLKLDFEAIPVAEDLRREPLLVQLYNDYQQLVKEANLLEKYPRLPLSDGVEYVGSKSCEPCHGYEYEKWSGNAHAHAYATLENFGSQYDPECVVCHVVGMRYESGFFSEQKTSHLRDVGCENCHGPASEHIRTAGAAKPAEPTSRCLDCHTPEHSGNYAGNEQYYLEKIAHWREPNRTVDVKKEGN